jgi:hypothetical protein
MIVCARNTMNVIWRRFDSVKTYLKLFFDPAPKVIWCDMFSVKIWIFCAIIKLFRHDIIIKYHAARTFTEKKLTFFQKRSLFLWIKKQPYSFSTKKKNGEGIVNDTNVLCNTILQSISDQMLEHGNYMPEWAGNDSLLSYRIKSALKTTIATKIWWQAGIILMAKEIHKLELENGERARVPVFIFQAFQETYFLRDILREANIIFIFGAVTRIWKLLKVFAEGLIVVHPKKLKTLFSRSPASNDDLSEDKRGKIFVEFCQMIFEGERSNLFWHKDSNLDSKRVVMYFDRSDSVANNQNIGMVEKEGMCWVNIDNLRSLRSYSTVLKKCLKGIIQMPFPETLSFYCIWRWITLIKINSQIEYWRHIFKLYNVKVIIQHQDATVVQILQAMAIKLEGGIMLGFLWSSPFNYRRPYEYYPQDVQFVWGKLSRDWIIHDNDKQRWVLTSGCIFDCYREKNKREGLSLRNKFSKEVKYIAGLFDLSYGSLFERDINLFYKTFLNYAVNHSNWGVFIKPKHLKMDEFPNKTINDTMLKLRKEGRCVVVDDAQNTSPAIAGYVADLCIGFHINSAAIVTAINGSISILWDVSGSTYHPLYKFNDAIIVYPNIKDIVSFLDRFATGKENSSDKVKRDRLLNKIDPFRDGKAAYRIGTFIKRFMDHMDSGLDKEEALAEVCNNYQQKYGEQSAINLFDNKSNSTNEDNLWSLRVN